MRANSPAPTGSIWPWTAIDADSKLIISWLVGSRDEAAAVEFCNDLASRLAGKIQLTTDGLTLYINAVEGAFGGAIDYAMLRKLYGASGNDASAETRYSPGRITAWQWFSNFLLKPFVSRVKRRMLIRAVRFQRSMYEVEM